MNKTIEVVQVGIADYQIAKEHQHLRTVGLGSCVGVVLYDLHSHVAGLAHIMLPSSNISKGSSFNLAKYADTAIPAMVSELNHTFNTTRNRLHAKIAGGAQMFQFSNQSDTMRVGPRNVEAVKETLQSLNIPILVEEIGGTNGRTIEFDPVTSKLTVRTIYKGTTTI
ncbi:chemotaxis protein CheD [Pseudalkalibacillus decolorationis]|uniref:chemotaxis protein CheD n=1 Tax=Pseudalkalibacillus decolorationis TaxID=163879 RepID=UPI0021484835|nr:chemotaxis protein CheD [Pseudalkalibacillus decolorationis]